MNPVDVKFGEWLEQGFALYKENIGVLILPAVLMVVLSMATIGILAGPLAAGLALITLRLKDGTGTKPELGDIFQGFSFFVNAFLLFVVTAVINIVGGRILALLPVIGNLASLFLSASVSALLLFALFLIVDKKMDFVPACKASIDVVKTNFWPFLGFSVVASVAGSLGAVACLIGIIVTLPFYFCTVAVAYRAVFGVVDAGSLVEPLTDEQKTDPSAPPPLP